MEGRGGGSGVCEHWLFVDMVSIPLQLFLMPTELQKSFVPELRSSSQYDLAYLSRGG